MDEGWLFKQFQFLLWPFAYVGAPMASIFVFWSVEISYWADFVTLPLSIIFWFISFGVDGAPVSWQFIGSIIIATA